MTGVSVELADLRGFAQQVGRASTHMGSGNDYARRHIADADFGKILEMMTHDYADLLTKFHTVLQADTTGLGKTRDGLDAVARSYQEADERSNERFTPLPGGGTGSISDDGVANGFDDSASPESKLVTPSGSGVELPELSFGMMFDTISDLIASVSGFDVREKITQWIVGDLEKASKQVEAWQHIADATQAVDSNLDSGRASIAKTWTGSAAGAANGHVDKWGSCLTEQSGAMRQMGKHLDDAIDQAVRMAQVVVDILRAVYQLLVAALSSASIPLYGQAKLIKSAWEAVKMCWSAWKVIRVFVTTIKMIVDYFKLAAGYFSMDKLPPAPAAVPA